MNTTKKQFRVKIYLSRQEDTMLKKQARSLHLSASAYLRWLIRKAGDECEK
jgi:DNA-binding MarR family transcriptional regulator